MESLIGFVALAAGLIIGLALPALVSESASWAASTWKRLLASLS